MNNKEIKKVKEMSCSCVHGFVHSLLAEVHDQGSLWGECYLLQND